MELCECVNASKNIPIHFQKTFQGQMNLGLYNYFIFYSIMTNKIA